MTTALSRLERAALTLLTAWMGERYFRTFRLAPDAEGFDALLTQRDRRIGVIIGALWEGEPPAGAADLEAVVGADLEADGDGGAYVLWAPPGASLPADEPKRSEFRLLITRGLANLAPGERREVRIPVTLRLAKIDSEGAYMSVVGGLASQWTLLSEGISGAFHLDSKDLHRLPDERAELDILLSRVRDRATLLETGEVTTVEVHDYWLVSRLPGEEPRGLTVLAAPPAFDATDGAIVRRLLRRHINRAVAQRAAGQCDMAALLLIAALPHAEEERATAALRGMNPMSYSDLDLIALVADGSVRQVLQPRQLPWAAAQSAPPA